MSKEFNVDGQIFTFDDQWTVSQYDEWPTYRSVAGGAIGALGCDLVAIKASRLYLIEVKDYTYQEVSSPPQDLYRTVARKAFDTMAMLFALRRTGSDEEQHFSDLAATCTEIQVCLNVEHRGGGLVASKGAGGAVQKQLSRAP